MLAIHVEPRSWHGSRRLRRPQRTLCGLYRTFGRRARPWPADGSAEELLHGLVVVVRAQECRADGRADGAAGHRSTASTDVAFHRAGYLVRRRRHGAHSRAHTLPKITAHGAISVWIIDDTGFPKKGKHSVGVARQYCGQIGKQDKCQVAVSLSIANNHASLPVAYQLYLPKVWADDQDRRDKVGVPEDIVFKTKPEIALDQLKWACETDLPRGVALVDAGYGVNAAFRSGMTALNLTYVAGVTSTTTVWAPGTAALAPARKIGPKPGRGRPAVRPAHDDVNKPVSVEHLALSLPKSSWKTIGWREGTNARLTGRFARVRVRPAHDRDIATEKIAEEWLLIEWPQDEKAPTKFWLSTLDATVIVTHLIHMTKMRWRIERATLLL